MDEAIIPATGTFVGRVWVPAGRADDGVAGPRVVWVREGRVLDLDAHFPLMADLLDSERPAEQIASLGELPVLATLEDVVRNSHYTRRQRRVEDESNIVLLAPCDLQAIKACGVTFVRSLLERVVEEHARGDAQAAQSVRRTIAAALGDDLSKVKPGSPETVELKRRLIEAGMWSQYLEVGIGPDAEVFTKAQPMSAVTYGQQVGILPTSTWNNPEPEVVLAAASSGVVQGATLGNDVNLRDYEGRSALLLGEAKDQNASCSIGPFIRLFDETFGSEGITRLSVTLTIEGEDGFRCSGTNRMSEISRPPAELARQVCGEHHQYPDGFMLFLGTMFAPTEDRGEAGKGFAHRVQDRVEIAADELGRLVNWVQHTDATPPWTFGTRALMRCMAERQRARQFKAR